MEYYIIDFLLLFLILITSLLLIGSTYYKCKNFSEFFGNIVGDKTTNFVNEYLFPPNSTQPNVDYQDYLNKTSGYDSGTRSYNNPFYAQSVASGLDTH